MAVYEIKGPGPVVVTQRKPAGRRVPVAEEISPTLRIDQFRQRWERIKDREPRKKRVPMSAKATKAVRHMLDQVNGSLTAQHYPLHLVLLKDDEGFYLDVYDCTNEKVCTVVRDMVIDLHDLPVLLRNLQQETGFLLDTVS